MYDIIYIKCEDWTNSETEIRLVVAFDVQLTEVSGRPDGVSGKRLETCKAGMPSPAHRDSTIPLGLGRPKNERKMHLKSPPS